MGCCSSSEDVQKEPPLKRPPPASVGVTAPKPPWEVSGQPPPGIIMSPNLPLSFEGQASQKRSAKDSAYERLVLISSRVQDPAKVAEAVLPNVAYILYDWKGCSSQELVQKVKKLIGGTKVTSIAVVAPGEEAGAVSLLEDVLTTKDSASGSEDSKVWKVLAGYLFPSCNSEMSRIDLLACRVLEDPKKAALLLQALSKLTDTPFHASDDALGGYLLTRCKEGPTLAQTDIKAMDLYFSRDKLMGGIATVKA